MRCTVDKTAAHNNGESLCRVSTIHHPTAELLGMNIIQLTWAATMSQSSQFKTLMITRRV